MRCGWVAWLLVLSGATSSLLGGCSSRVPVEATLGGSTSTRATLLAAALGLVGACTTITEFPAAGSTVDVVDASTTTTGLLPTGVDPTAASSSGASSSSDSTLDTSTSDPTNGDFVGPGPDVPAVELCDVWDDDCPRGEKCTFWANDGGALPNSTRCVPLDANPAGPGEPCRAESLGFDDCDVGSMCWNVDRTGHGECIPFCTGSPEEGTTDTELHAAGHTIWYQFLRLWYREAG